MKRKFNDSLSVERLREFLSYDPSTGIFRTKTRASNRRGGDYRVVGTIAGCIDTSGYMRIKIDGKKYQANRLAWLYVHGCWPESFIDHINHNPLDNRIENLREATNAENLQNQVRAHKRNSTGLLGVSARRKENRFVASIRIGGRPKYLGYFKTAEEAHTAYLKAKAEIHPFATFGGKSFSDYVKSQAVQ